MKRIIRNISLGLTGVTMLAMSLTPAFAALCVAANGASCDGDCCRAAPTYCVVIACPAM